MKEWERIWWSVAATREELVARCEALTAAIEDTLCDEVPCQRCDHLRAALSTEDRPHDTTSKGDQP